MCKYVNGDTIASLHFASFNYFDYNMQSDFLPKIQIYIGIKNEKFRSSNLAATTKSPMISPANTSRESFSPPLQQHFQHHQFNSESPDHTDHSSSINDRRILSTSHLRNFTFVFYKVYKSIQNQLFKRKINKQKVFEEWVLN